MSSPPNKFCLIDRHEEGPKYMRHHWALKYMKPEVHEGKHDLLVKIGSYFQLLSYKVPSDLSGFQTTTVLNIILEDAGVYNKTDEINEAAQRMTRFRLPTCLQPSIMTDFLLPLVTCNWLMFLSPNRSLERHNRKQPSSITTAVLDWPMHIDEIVVNKIFLCNWRTFVNLQFDSHDQQHASRKDADAHFKRIKVEEDNPDIE